MMMARLSPGVDWGKIKKKGSYKVNDYRKSTLERSGVMQNSQLNPDKLERLK